MPKSSSRIRAGIIGGAGYTGGELIRLLLNHPSVEIAFVHSRSNDGRLVSDVHTDLIGETYLKFSQGLEAADVLFLCLSHGESRTFLRDNPVPAGTRIIDLSQDFRLNGEADGFVYGLPELNREKISSALKVANPGCFATCIQLALLPLARHKLLQADIHVTATTGSTGAGQTLSPTSHFSWRFGNMSVYKPFDHQHVPEIGQSLRQLQENFTHDIHFIPHRGSYARGILASLYLNCSADTEQVRELYRSYYGKEPFVRITASSVDLKQVVNTNKCFLNVEKHEGKLFIVSTLDNLLKGASGQAVQNMNLMFGIPEEEGLKLKAVAF
jgi:N-acetyl-gamma-glutamyl-phosphate reductase